MSDDLSKELRFELNVTGFPDDKFKVVKLDGTEAISQLFKFELVVVSGDANIDLGGLIGSAAKLIIKSQYQLPPAPEQKKSYYYGVLSEVEQLGKTNEYYFYRVILSPTLSKLTYDKLTDVYLKDQLVFKTVEDALVNSGFKLGVDISMPPNDPPEYQKQDFVCQYEESTFNFVCRWLEKMGRYFYYDHSETVNVVRFFDDKNLQPKSGVFKISLDYCQPEDLQTAASDNCVYNFKKTQMVTAANVIVQDYNYNNAALGDGLRAEAPVVTPKASGNLLCNGENVRDTTEAKKIAAIRQEELVAHSAQYSADSMAVGLRCGVYLTVSKHFRADINSEYLITEVVHHGSQAGVLLANTNSPYLKETMVNGYACSFKAIKGEVQFRPKLLTTRPKVSGLLVAKIDKEGSDTTAQLDEKGRYKIDPLFDLTAHDVNKKSAWVRMATPYAGLQNGMHFPLLKEAEVAIAFYRGDPDLPVIVGALTNSESKNVTTSENATKNIISTAGGNKVYISDDKDAQAIRLFSPSGSTTLIIGNVTTDA